MMKMERTKDLPRYHCHKFQEARRELIRRCLVGRRQRKLSTGGSLTDAADLPLNQWLQRAFQIHTWLMVIVLKACVREGAAS